MLVRKHISIYTEPGVHKNFGILAQASINKLLDTFEIPHHEMRAELRENWGRRDAQSHQPFASSNWCIESARDPRSRNLLTRYLWPTFNNKRWRFDVNRYIFIIAKSRIATNEEGPIVYGCTSPNFASIVSYESFYHRGQKNRVNYKRLETLIYHEFGHLIGLMDDDMTHQVNLDFAGTTHCTNRCTMRQGYSQQEWERFTTDRKRDLSPYCNRCTEWLLRQLHV